MRKLSEMSEKQLRHRQVLDATNKIYLAMDEHDYLAAQTFNDEAGIIIESLLRQENIILEQNNGK